MNARVWVPSFMAIVCGFAVTIVSCNSDSNGVADAPARPTHGEKTPQVLNTNCNSILAVDRCGVGGATTSFDQSTGRVSVTGLHDAASGVKSTFADAHNWHQIIKTELPSSSSQNLSAVAYQDNIRQARLDIRVSDSDPSQISMKPTFDAGDGIYKVQVYDHGNLVVEKSDLAPGSHTQEYRRIIPFYWGFGVWTYWIIDKQQQKGGQLNAASEVQVGACQWIVGSPDDDNVDITLPDGTTATGNEIRFIEQVDGSGRYPYHTTNRIDVLSNLGTLDVISETAAN